MTYAIGQIIYGLDLTSIEDLDPNGLLADLDTDELEEFVESRYVESAYSGGGDEPRWFGITQGSIDECSTERGDVLIKMLTVTQAHRDQYGELIERLRADEDWSQALRDAIIGEIAHTWLLWGSS